MAWKLQFYEKQQTNNNDVNYLAILLSECGKQETCYKTVKVVYKTIRIATAKSATSEVHVRVSPVRVSIELRLELQN